MSAMFSLQERRLSDYDLDGERPTLPPRYLGPFEALLECALAQQEARSAFQAFALPGQNVDANSLEIEMGGFTFTFRRMLNLKPSWCVTRYIPNPSAPDKMMVDAPYECDVAFRVRPAEIATGARWAWRFDPNGEKTVRNIAYVFWTGAPQRELVTGFYFHNQLSPKSSEKVLVLGAGAAFLEIEKALEKRWAANRRLAKRAQAAWDKANPTKIAEMAAEKAVVQNVELTNDSIEFAACMAKAQTALDTMQNALRNKTFNSKLCTELHRACNEVSAMQRQFRFRHCTKKSQKR